MNRKLRLFFASCAALAQISPVWAQSLEDAVSNGKIFGEMRYRYEQVEQEGIPRTATANTLRASMGFETGIYKGFNALVEAQTVRHMGGDKFNDTVNGNAAYPVIPDPENSEFNQAWLAWSGPAGFSVKAGRQQILLDNQRFVGNVGWRQNDQTFDAASVAFAPSDKTSFSYSYVWNVNRIFGEHSAIPDYTGNTHLLHGEHAFADWLKVSAYGYFTDINEAPASSSRTLGMQATGKVPLNGDWKFQYLAEYARQRDSKNSPLRYSEDYFHIAPSLSWKNLTLQAGYESLGGNGTSAFQTPLATLHAFNGAADKFLVTPAGGLEDAYGRIAYKIENAEKWINGTTLEAAYHDFRAQSTSVDYGTEWDFQVRKSFTTKDFVVKNWTVSAKYADYQADQHMTDTKKLWLTVNTKF